MKNTYMISMLISLVLFSCTSITNKQDEPTKLIHMVAETDSLFKVEEGGYALAITLPKALLKEDSKFGYRSNFGDVELFIDSKFHLFITNEQLSLTTLKEELEQNELFSRKFYNEAPNELLYQSLLPDGTEMGFQWIKQITLNEQSYFILTEPRRDYSKQHIRKIQDCCKSIKLL